MSCFARRSTDSSSSSVYFVFIRCGPEISAVHICQVVLNIDVQTLPQRKHLPHKNLCIFLCWKAGKTWEFLFQVLSHTGLSWNCFAFSHTSHLWFRAGWICWFIVWAILQCQRKEAPFLECENCIIIIFGRWIVFLQSLQMLYWGDWLAWEFIWKLFQIAGLEKRENSVTLGARNLIECTFRHYIFFSFIWPFMSFFCHSELQLDRVYHNSGGTNSAWSILKHYGYHIVIVTDGFISVE